MPFTKIIGGTLLIIGTSIGGGMLALPISSVQIGFFNSVIFLTLCWLIMTAGALLILEVNLRLPAGSNIISMAGLTLGLPGKIIAWIIYLCLLYTLLAGYISGGNDVFNYILQVNYISLPYWITALIFTCLLGYIVYKGIHAVDYVNRGLMFGKLGIYLILITSIIPYANMQTLNNGEVKYITSSIMILITSFGFASIVPSLREYFKEDIPTLRRIIIFGSFIPLICYILWNAVIMSVIPNEGENSLIKLMHSGNATSGLTVALAKTLQNKWITSFFNFFTSICMLTAFLSVSIGLFDFLSDGLALKKHGKEGKALFLLTFLPPLIVVLINPALYLKALNYAGICCIILLLLLPTAMAWRARKIPAADIWVLPGGAITLGILTITAIFLLVVAGFELTQNHFL